MTNIVCLKGSDLIVSEEKGWFDDLFYAYSVKNTQGSLCAAGVLNVDRQPMTQCMGSASLSMDSKSRQCVTQCVTHREARRRSGTDSCCFHSWGSHESSWRVAGGRVPWREQRLSHQLCQVLSGGKGQLRHSASVLETPDDLPQAFVEVYYILGNSYFRLRKQRSSKEKKVKCSWKCPG